MYRSEITSLASHLGNVPTLGFLSIVKHEAKIIMNLNIPDHKVHQAASYAYSLRAGAILHSIGWFRPMDILLL